MNARPNACAHRGARDLDQGTQLLRERLDEVRSQTTARPR
jgi:hypothetical protein